MNREFRPQNEGRICWGDREAKPPREKIWVFTSSKWIFLYQSYLGDLLSAKIPPYLGDLFTGVFIKRRSVNRCLKFVCDVCQKGGSGGEAPRENFGLFVAVFRDPNCFFALQILGENFRPFRHFHFREKIPLSVISHQKLVGKFSPNYGGKHCYHPLI